MTNLLELPDDVLQVIAQILIRGATYFHSQKPVLEVMGSLMRTCKRFMAVCKRECTFVKLTIEKRKWSMKAHSSSFFTELSAVKVRAQNKSVRGSFDLGDGY